MIVQNGSLESGRPNPVSFLTHKHGLLHILHSKQYKQTLITQFPSKYPTKFHQNTHTYLIRGWSRRGVTPLPHDGGITLTLFPLSVTHFPLSVTYFGTRSPFKTLWISYLFPLKHIKFCLFLRFILITSSNIPSTRAVTQLVNTYKWHNYRNSIKSIYT